MRNNNWFCYAVQHIFIPLMLYALLQAVYCWCFCNFDFPICPTFQLRYLSKPSVFILLNLLEVLLKSHACAVFHKPRLSCNLYFPLTENSEVVIDLIRSRCAGVLYSPLAHRKAPWLCAFRESASCFLFPSEACSLAAFESAILWKNIK